MDSPEAPFKIMDSLEAPHSKMGYLKTVHTFKRAPHSKMRKTI
ncbi:unnamed protein product, partial [Staurois parvus]